MELANTTMPMLPEHQANCDPEASHRLSQAAKMANHELIPFADGNDAIARIFWEKHWPKTTMSKARPLAPPNKKFRTVHFSYTDPTARKVSVAGTFNNWTSEAGEMVPTEKGHWDRDLTMALGLHEYRFVVDGHWILDPNAEHAVQNHRGEWNSLVLVSDDN